MSMVCEECKERDATVFLTQIINGETIKVSLCERCASPILDQLPQEHRGLPTGLPVFKPLPPIPPDPNRPATISIPDPVIVRVLAEKLRVKPFKLIPELMVLNVFVTKDHKIDFTIASAVCARYGVVAQKLEEPE